jgi:putative aminopeptidase FrvX
MRYFSNRRIMRLKKVEEQSMDGTLDPDQVITSRNVIAEIGPADAEQQILFTAHFDSISSTIPTRLMMISMLIGFVGALVYSVLYLVNMIVDGNFIAANLPAYAVFASILAVLLGIVFLSRSLRSNKSHGIIDDGTGVAILLELSKLVKARPIPGYKFIFGFYGSEESGLIGSTYDYMKREIDKDRLRVISVDMIGEKPPLAYVKKIALIRGAIMDPTLNEQIVSIAESLDIEIEGKNFPYSGSDFAPFMLLGGCRANWIINRSRLIHSKNDHLGNVNEILVNDAMKLIAGYLLQLEA